MICIYSLKEHCEQNKIEFLSTAFGVEELKFLMEHGIKRIKIPSRRVDKFTIFGGGIVCRIAYYSINWHVNTSQISASVDILMRNGLDLEDLTILHCTTDYPAPFHTLNMSAISTIKNEFGSAVGYSDHSEG